MRMIPGLMIGTCLLLVPDGLQGGDAKPSEKSRLIGTWKIVTFQDDGRDRLGRLGAGKSPKKGQKPRIVKLVFTETECWVIRGDGKREVRAGLANCAWKAWKLPLGRGSSEIDLVGHSGKDGNKTKTYVGIWQIKDAKLSICWNESGKARPEKFVSDGSMNLFVCERLSDKPEKPLK